MSRRLPPNQVLYLAVTPDIYELPMVVCDTAQDLANWAGVNKLNVLTSISHHRVGHRKGYSFVRVYLNKEDAYEQEGFSY